jgi:hypothetical protein
LFEEQATAAKRGLNGEITAMPFVFEIKLGKYYNGLTPTAPFPADRCPRAAGYRLFRHR